MSRANRCPDPSSDANSFGGAQRLLDTLAVPRRWLVTGAAGFIGSNLVEGLLRSGQEVVGLDNFSKGHKENLDELLAQVGEAAARFRFVEADIRDVDACRAACIDVHHVCHHAALGSVPASLEDPALFHAVNDVGFHNMLIAARDQGVASFVYASSSAVYGDCDSVASEDALSGKPLSPYAANKLSNELYAGIFARCYGMAINGLRYFNVYGPRQDPAGAYAAVIPLWASAMRDGLPIHVNGRGNTSRDFCYVSDVVQANIAASLRAGRGQHSVYNVGYGRGVSLNELREAIAASLFSSGHQVTSEVVHEAYRLGDILHSCASIEKAREHLGFVPEFALERGLELTVEWFLKPSRVAVAPDQDVI